MDKQAKISVEECRELVLESCFDVSECVSVATVDMIFQMLKTVFLNGAKEYALEEVLSVLDIGYQTIRPEIAAKTKSMLVEIHKKGGL